MQNGAAWSGFDKTHFKIIQLRRLSTSVGLKYNSSSNLFMNLGRPVFKNADKRFCLKKIAAEHSWTFIHYWICDGFVKKLLNRLVTSASKNTSPGCMAEV